MEYFRFSYDVDSEDTGHVFPQVIFKNPKKLEPNPVLMANMANHGQFPPDDILPFDFLEVNNGAKITSVMSSPFNNGFLINKKVKNILEKSCIDNFRFYKIKLLNKKVDLNEYYYFHSASNLKEYVDYPKSLFSANLLSDRPVYDLPKVNSWEELNIINKTLSNGLSVTAKCLYLKSNFPYNLDFFKLYAFDYDFYISNTLKDNLIKNGINGIKIESAKGFIKTDNFS